VLPASSSADPPSSICRDRLHHLRLRVCRRADDVRRQIHLAAALAELGGLLRHAGFGGGPRGCVIAASGAGGAGGVLAPSWAGDACRSGSPRNPEYWSQCAAGAPPVVHRPSVALNTPRLAPPHPPRRPLLFSGQTFVPHLLHTRWPSRILCLLPECADSYA
jgi:hypothetical protein